jgi:hypothetical protein
MNVHDAAGFENRGLFLDALPDWHNFHGPATYLLARRHPIPRLNSASDILYVGHSRNLGGNRRSRLWHYYNQLNPTHAACRIRKSSRRCANLGHSILLFVCCAAPSPMTCAQYCSELLRRYFADHWELPPFNIDTRGLRTEVTLDHPRPDSWTVASISAARNSAPHPDRTLRQPTRAADNVLYLFAPNPAQQRISPFKR